MATLIQLRRDTAANWTSVNPTLAQGEIGIETDTNKFKIGDGTTAWATLVYAGGGAVSNAYGYSLNESTRVYTKLGVAGHVVHDKIRQCVQNDDGTIAYFLDPSNGWDKENYKPTRRFADKTQSIQVIDHILSLDAFRSTVAGQGISNSRGEYAVITAVTDQSNVEIDEIAPVHKVYGSSTTTTQDHLIDSANAFSNVNVGDVVHNRSTGDKAKVTNVGANDLTLDADIFQNETPGEFYSIYAPFLGNNEEFYVHTAVVDGSDGQIMVYIPKFYYKYAYATGVHSWMISDTLEDGYEVHPAFVVDGEEVDYITIGAFEGWDDAVPEGGNKLYSIVNKLPSSNMTRAQFRASAANRSASHTQLLYYQNWAVQILYITYFGNWDSQAVIGKAMTYFGDGGSQAFGLVTINDGNYAVTKTGISLKNGIKTAGEYADTYDPIAYMSLFGIENVYGNLLKWVDGINVEQLSRKIYLCNTPADLADDTDTGYDDSGITYVGNPNDRSVGLTLENSGKILLPATYGEGIAIIPDWIGFYADQEESWRVACSGGGCYYEAGAGVAVLDAYGGSTNAVDGIGARLCFCGVVLQQM